MEKYNHIRDLMDQSMQADKNKLDQLEQQEKKQYRQVMNPHIN